MSWDLVGKIIVAFLTCLTAFFYAAKIAIKFYWDQATKIEELKKALTDKAILDLKKVVDEMDGKVKAFDAALKQHGVRLDKAVHGIEGAHKKYSETADSLKEFVKAWRANEEWTKSKFKAQDALLTQHASEIVKLGGNTILIRDKKAGGKQ